MNKIKFFIQFTLIVVITVAYSIYVLFVMLFSKNNKIFHTYAKKWSKLILKICGVEYTIENRSTISDTNSYVYVCNHSSLFDIPILLASLQTDVRIMYKKELEKIPVFGFCLRKSPYISVVRSDPKNALSSLEVAINAMKENISVIIFAEGTRSIDGKLGEFKRGAFYLAVKSGKQIVPVTIIGSNSILTPGSLYFKKGNIKVIIDKEIDSEGISDKVIMPKVKEIIQNNLNS
jgi:1-acyl-sn-glycerol-3-phosphate acyltransferase